MLIREATTRADLEEIRGLFLEYRDAVGGVQCFAGFQEEVAGLPGGYARPGGRLLFALDGQTALGCVGIRALTASDCELKRLYVRPAGRRGGVGRRLVTTALDEARASGYERVVLETLPSMAEAIVLYRSLGFLEAPWHRAPVEGTRYLALEL